jgi:hypothetical protein
MNDNIMSSPGKGTLNLSSPVKSMDTLPVKSLFSSSHSQKKNTPSLKLEKQEADPRGDSRCFFGDGGYSGEIITFCETKNGDGNTFPFGDLNGSDCFLGENGKSEEKEEKRL